MCRAERLKVFAALRLLLLSSADTVVRETRSIYRLVGFTVCGTFALGLEKDPAVRAVRIRVQCRPEPVKGKPSPNPAAAYSRT
jgi:hypothetical protein